MPPGDIDACEIALVGLTTSTHLESSQLPFCLKPGKLMKNLACFKAYWRTVRGLTPSAFVELVRAWAPKVCGTRGPPPTGTGALRSRRSSPHRRVPAWCSPCEWT